MPLSPEEKLQVIDALRAKGANFATCQICGVSEWTLMDGWVAVSLQSKPGDIAVSGLSLPAFVVICLNCGNTLMFNAIILGLQGMVGYRAS